MSGQTGIKISVEIGLPKGGGPGKAGVDPQPRKRRTKVRRPGGQLPVYEYAKSGGVAQPAKTHYYGAGSGNTNE